MAYNRNTRFVFVLGTILVTLISLLVSLLLAYWVAERYFFDKLFYKKSIAHGYWQRYSRLEDYGSRSRDLVNLKSLWGSKYRNNQILGASENLEGKDVYTIAVIGDSYVWGVGLRFKQTFTQILEKKLNQARKTKVLVFGNSGDSILEYLDRYYVASQVHPVNLFIFVLTENDMMLNADDRLVSSIARDILTECSEEIQLTPIVYDPSTFYNNRMQVKNAGFTNELEAKVVSAIVSSCRTESNLCVTDSVLNFLSKVGHSAIYFVSDNYRNDRYCWDVYISAMSTYNLNMVSSSEGRSIKKYIKHWNDPFKNFTVSPQETHPSKIAHQMYADILYNEIVGDMKYGFTAK